MWNPSHRQPLVHCEVFEQDGVCTPSTRLAVGDSAPNGQVI